MKMGLIDWSIVSGFVIIVAASAIYVRKYTLSVVDFLAAGRCAGRYMLTMSEGVAGLGAISVIGYFEQHYAAGFVPLWWQWMMMATTIGIALSGWILYRYRQTRAMTMAQFFEMRYSRKFRIYAGLIAYFSGLLNFAIFPAVGARFFIYFCGFQDSYNICGIQISTLAIMMTVLLSIALLFTLLGGQIAILVTDFLQGLFLMVAFMIIIVSVMCIFSWSQISQALLMAPPHASLVDPFDSMKVKDFNIWFFLISAFGTIYAYKAWHGTQGFNCAAKTPHEARMGSILGTWRTQVICLLVTILPISAFTFLHHPDFSSQAQAVQESIQIIPNQQIQIQMTVPVALTFYLPVGIMGLFCAAMFAAFIGNHNTYLHSWGSMFIQDIVLPFRKKNLCPREHLKLLRWSIVGVAIFIFVFSLLFEQSQFIFLYFAITGSIYVAGAGICIIGGLYWDRGTTTAAWSALIIGPLISMIGLIIKMRYPAFPINEQWMWLICMCVCTVVYVVVSLAGSVEKFDMDKLLHRGTCVQSNETVSAKKASSGLLKILGIGKDFTLSDKVVYIGTLVWTIGLSLVFLFITLFAIIFGFSINFWLNVWRIYLWVGFSISLVVTLWLAIGGFKDMKDMFRTLDIMERDDMDNGSVNHELSEEESFAVRNSEDA